MVESRKGKDGRKKEKMAREKNNEKKDWKKKIKVK